MRDSSKPRHPGRSAAERRILDEVGCGQNTPRAYQKTLDRMVAAGLLTFLGHETIGRDALGAIRLPVYEMPAHVHIRWCEFHAQAEEPAS